MSAIEDWLKRRSFECPQLRARISPEQCDANREIAGAEPEPGWRRHCLSCAEFEERTAGVERREEMDPQHAAARKKVVMDRLKELEVPFFRGAKLPALESLLAKAEAANRTMSSRTSTEEEPQEMAQQTKKTGLAALLRTPPPAPDGLFIPFTHDETVELIEAGVGVDDIRQLALYLLAGELQRVEKGEA